MSGVEIRPFDPACELGAEQRETIGHGHCPDCNYRGFVLGPRGGVAINIECGNTACGSRFNVVCLPGDHRAIIFAHRIGGEGVPS